MSDFAKTKMQNVSDLHNFSFMKITWHKNHKEPIAIEHVGGKIYEKPRPGDL
jgi:hypothetical protein